MSKDIIKDNIILNEIDYVIDLLNINLLKTYFYLGEYEEGLYVLKNIFKKDPNQEANFESSHMENTVGANYSLPVSKEFFKKPKAIEIFEEINFELEKIDSYSVSEINVLLVEDSGKVDDSFEFGYINSLICSVKRIKQNGFLFDLENTTDLSDNELAKSRDVLNSTLVKLLLKRKHFRSPYHLNFKLHFDSYRSIYKGTSFLLPASLISFCVCVLTGSNMFEYLVNSSAVFTGSVDSSGDTQKLPEVSLNSKIYTSFFSWVKYVVIPASNLTKATEILENLLIKYPNRKIELIGISNIIEIFNYPVIMKPVKVSYSKYVEKSIRKNLMTYLIIFSLLFFCLGIYLTQQLLPGDFKPLPQKNSTRSLIYVPDRDTNWIFENLWSQQDDTINFGDVAVGDSWFPLIDFYNNSRDPEVFDVSIDGMDKNDFEILWRVEDNQPFVPQILPDVLQRLYIKFRPLDYNNLGSKTATLTFTSVSNKNNKKSIFLKANSSRLDNGYSLFFDNPGDMLILDPQKNILGDNYTFEFWLKPRITGDYNQTAILQNDNGSNHKFYLDINKDSSLSLFVNSRKAVERIIFLKSSSKLKLSEWNHVAFSVSPDKIFLILNNSYSEMKTYSEITRNISDRIYFGFSKSPEKIKPESLTNAGFQYLISGLSVWNKIIDSDYLINNKYKRKQGSESNLLFAYNFSEANWETVFDLSPNDYWGSLRGGIKRKLDSPFNPPYSEHSPGNSENKILHLKDKSLMFFTKTLFDKPSSFSVQVDAKFIVKDTGMAGSFFDLSHPDILLRTDIYKSYIDLHYNNSKSNMALSEKKEFYTAGEWHNYLFVYSLDKDLAALFIDSLLFLEIKLPEKFDISRWYYGMSFGGRHFFYAPLYFNQESFIDNVKIFRGAVWKNNTFTFLPDSLLAFWSFEKNNKELIIDNINNYPAFLYNNFEILHSN